MKITIFGATGSIGRLAVERALKIGFEVIALARNPEKLEKTHHNLEL